MDFRLSFRLKITNFWTIIRYKYLNLGVFNLVSTLNSRYSYANISLIKDISPNYEITVGKYDTYKGLSYIENYNDPNKIDFSLRVMKYPTYFTLLLAIS